MMAELDHFFQPRSIAVYGASERPGSMGGLVLQNLLRAGYKGPVLAVNRKAYTTVQGVPCVRALTPEQDVDLAVLCLPARNLYRALRNAADAGVRSALILTGGMVRDQLSDTAMRRLKLVARRRQVRLLGPNSLGLIVPGARLNLSYSHVDPLAGNIAYVGMSSSLGSALLDWATGRGYGFSHFVTLGARADISLSDVVDHLANDRRVKAILLHVENIRNAERFMTVLRAASRTKRVLMLHTDTATRVPPGLADRDALMTTYFERAGVVNTDSFQGLLGTVQTLVRARPLYAHNLALISNGLGPALLAQQAFARQGGELFHLGPLPESVRSDSLHLDRTDGRFLVVSAGISPERLTETLAGMDQLPGVGALLVMLVPNVSLDQAGITQALIGFQRRTRRTLMVVWLGEETVQAAREALDSANVLQFKSVEAAISAYASIVRYEQVQQNLRATPWVNQRVRVPPAQLAALHRAALAPSRPWLSWALTRELLNRFGFRLNPANWFETADELRAALPYAAYPLSLRLLHRDYMFPFAYRADARRRWRGVAIDLTSPQEVEVHLERLLVEHGQHFPDSERLGFTLQPMRRRLDSLQFSLGATRDQVLGPVLLFGLGGGAANVRYDRQVALPPLNRSLAGLLIDTSRVSPLLQERCQHPALARNALIEALMRLSELVEVCPWVEGLEMDLLLEQESDLVVLGAAACQGAPARPVIATYPLAWEKTLKPAGVSTEWMLRPVRAEDEPGLKSLYERQSAEALRLRFFGSRLQFQHRELAALCQIDYRREMAFVLADAAGQLVGEIRGWTRVDARSMEFAILLDPAARGKQLSDQLLRHLEAYAQAQQVTTMRADVLRENRPMRALGKRLGYIETPDPEGSLILSKNLNAV